MGILVGALFHHTSKELNLFYCAMLGSGWPYVAISLKKFAEVLGDGIQKHGSTAAKEFMKSVIESMDREDNKITTGDDNVANS